MSQSQLIFDPATGLVAPDTSEIREAVAQDWITAFADPDKPALDTEPTTPAGQLVDAETAEIEAMHAALLFLANQFNPRVATGIWQDALAAIYFIDRKLAEPTIVTCQLTGLNGTVIPYGALVQSTTGYTLICNNSVTIGPASTASTTFRVSTYGPIEIAPHTVNRIITVIPGWDTVDNEAAGAVGRDVEARFDFEARRAESVAINAHGSVGAIYGYLANLDGVLDIAVLENIGPNPIVEYGVTIPGHGVTICIYGGSNDDIAEGIYRKKDNGADTGGNTTVKYTATEIPGNPVYTYLILRPTPINFWVRITVSEQLTATTIAAIKQAVFDDFYGINAQSGNRRVGLASTVFASRFYCPVLAVDGVRAVISIEIALSVNKPSASGYGDSVTIRGDQEPVLATSNIDVITP